MIKGKELKTFHGWSWSEGYNDGFDDGLAVGFFRGIGIGACAMGIISALIVWLM